MDRSSYTMVSGSSSAQLEKIPTATLYDRLHPIAVPRYSSRARFMNWGGTYACTPLVIYEPETEAQCALILELARREKKHVRFAGVGHSPSDLACTTEYMLRTTRLNKVLEVNVEKSYVVVQGGIKLHDLHEQLASHNLAMSNLGSISDQTLAGVVTTATHGSGLHFGVLSTHVLALTLMLADGTKVTCSSAEHFELYKASLCGLGATGLILSITMQVEPAYRLKEVQNTISFDTLLGEFDELIGAAEHVRFWWFPQNGLVRTSYANRTIEDSKPAGSWLWHRFFGYHVIQLMLFIGRFFLFVNTWTAIFAEWLIRGETTGIDVSHRIFNVDCRYPQYTTEWAVPLENARRCLLEFRDWLDNEFADAKGIRPHFPIEIRFTDADDIWLSPGYGKRMCWIGIVQYKPYGFNVPYRRLFEAYETIVTRHGGRPHWAKAHALRPSELRKLYPKFDDFVDVLNLYDPDGVFRNEYVRRHIYGEEVHARVFKPTRR